MNKVGEGGKGESVWLGWFLAHTFGALCPMFPGAVETQFLPNAG